MEANDAIHLERWIAHRDPEAFRSIVLRYAAMVYATSKRIVGNSTDAEDVSQECFQALAVAKRPPSAYLGPWLHRVATNIALNRRRSDGRLRTREERFASAQPVSTQPNWNDIYRFVDEAVAALPEDLRVPIVAHFLEGKSQAEISAELNTPRQTIANRTQRGLDAIRKNLAQRGIEIGCATLGSLFIANVSQAAVPPQLIAMLGKMALSGAGKSAAAANPAWWMLSGGAMKIALGGAVALAMVVAGLAASGIADAGQSSDSPERATTTPAIDIETAIANQRAASTNRVVAEPPVARQGLVLTPAPRAQANTAVPDAPIQPKSVQQVLDLYASYQKKIERIAFQYEAKTVWSRFYPRNSEMAFTNGSGTTYESGELTTDGARLHLHMYSWGDIGTPNENISPNKPYERIIGYDGQQDFQWDGSAGEGRGSIGKGAPLGETLNGAPSNGRYYGIWAMHAGPYGLGFMTQEGRRIEQILRESTDKSMREELDGETKYIVVDADTPYGAFSVWFDPERGFNVTRIRLLHQAGDVLRKGDDRPQPEGVERIHEYIATDFETVDGLWVVKSYIHRMNDKNTVTGYRMEREMIYTRTSTLLNPDFDGLGTFAHLREVPDGSEFWVRTFPGDRLTDENTFRVVNGELVPMSVYKASR